MKEDIQEKIKKGVNNSLICLKKIDIHNDNFIDEIKFINLIRNEYAEDYLHSSKKYSVNETFKWFFKNCPEYYIIYYSQIPVGYFRTSNYSNENNNIYIGADIHSDYCGLKLSYNSYIKFINQLFEEKKLNKISLEVLSTNTRAINLYKKLGFVVEGIRRQEVLKQDQYIDSIVMSILKSEWKESSI
jgi:RimJ/RimL family protein N-acetyltransferase